MFIDNYLTIQDSSEGEYKEKGSKFLAYAYPIHSEKDLDACMDLTKDIHPKARHYCYAYKLGMDGNRFRINDDGEPSGTAGKPIYGQILSHQLTDICIIVVRYFGGTKLGATGLIHAYKEAAREALSTAQIFEKYLFDHFKFNFGYDQMGHIMNVLKEENVEITEKTFDLNCEVKIALKMSQSKATLLRIKAKLLDKSLEEVHEETIVDFCKITKTTN